MVNRSEGLLYQTGQGASALDAQAHRDRLDGYAVTDGLGVTHSSGLTLSVASGTATVGETSGTVDTVSLGSSTTVTLDAADSTYPRKDTIYIDSSGTVQAETGTAEEALPSGNTRFNTYQPEPPFPSTEGTILAEVWVPAGATTLQSADIRDRRAPADVVVDRAVIDTVESGSVSAENHSSKESNGSYSANWLVEEGVATDIGDAVNQLWSSGFRRVTVEGGNYENITTIDLANCPGDARLHAAGGVIIDNDVAAIENTGASGPARIEIDGFWITAKNGSPSLLCDFTGVHASRLSNLRLDGRGNANTVAKFNAQGGRGFNNTCVNVKVEDAADTELELGNPNGLSWFGGYVRGSANGNIGIKFTGPGDTFWFGSEVSGHNNGKTDNVGVQFQDSGKFIGMGNRFEENTNLAEADGNNGHFLSPNSFVFSEGGLVNPGGFETYIKPTYWGDLLADERSGSAPTPDRGVSISYRTDTSPERVEAIRPDGSTTTLGTF